MGLSLRKLFKAREKPGEDVQRVSSVEIADQQVRDAVTEICLRELAFWTCVGKIANALTKCEFRTFYEGEELFKDEYYLWNYEPNRNQNKAEFLSKAMEQLFRNNELLIVESYDGQLLVADDFSVTKNALYGDTYTNVQVDDYTFSRSFRSSDVLHWTLNNKNVNRIMQDIPLPIVVWLTPGTDNFFADGKTYKKITKLDIELYTDDKDWELEKKLEEILDKHDIAWEQTASEWLESEKMWESLYEMEV